MPSFRRSAAYYDVRLTQWEICHSLWDSFPSVELHDYARAWLRRRDGLTVVYRDCLANNPDSKVPGANIGPIWGRQDPGGPYVGPMNLVIRER